MKCIHLSVFLDLCFFSSSLLLEKEEPDLINTGKTMGTGIIFFLPILSLICLAASRDCGIFDKMIFRLETVLV